MKLICLSCGHTLDLRDAYDDYEGKVKCFICGAMLTVRTCDGQVKAVDVAASPRPVATAPLSDFHAVVLPAPAGDFSL